MKHDHSEAGQKHKIEMKKKKEFSKRKKDSFSELTQWIREMKRPAKNQVLSQQEMFEIRDYIEITQKIQLCKKTSGQFVSFCCKNAAQCEYSIQFQKLSSLKIYKKQPHYRVLRCPRPHSSKADSNCNLTEDQNTLLQRKKYLFLIRPLLKKIISSDQCKPKDKNPTWVMERLEMLKEQKREFLYENLAGRQRRQFKKAFDNVIGNIKNEIKVQLGLAAKSFQKLKKTKKIRKVKKTKVKKESKSNQIFQQSPNKLDQQQNEIKMIEQEEYVQPNSPNVFEKCSKQVKSEEICHQNHQNKIKQLNQYLTPTKNKNKSGFDLQKSAQKPPTFYKSYQQSFLHLGIEKQNKIQCDSDSDDKNHIWTPQKAFIKHQKRMSADFNLESKFSVSNNQSKGLNESIFEDESENKAKKKGFQRYFL